MLYEMRTYTMRVGAVGDFEKNFEARLPYREKHSKLGGMWHSDIGPLNQMVHIWPYEDLNQRMAVREAMAKDPDIQSRMGGGGAQIMDQQVDIMFAAPFNKELGSQDLGKGNIYEMRIYTLQVGTTRKVIEAWGECIEERAKISPFVGAWYTEIGALNKWVHLWVYKDLADRTAKRAEAAKLTNWPPKTGDATLRQENKILIPASFSPLQ
jgi:hypothetical protein